ncbi:MAG TPA: hypothetical protein VH595_17555 [Verrucomicrobiae bacterium]|nr:hypothetical protein [Verrucomicrobiae bacterium]
MKRGIALLNENSPAALAAAIGNFDQAIELRRRLPLDANPMYRYALAASWMNQGDALTKLGSADDLAEALRSYDAALEALRGLSLDANPLFRRRMAIAWQNRGLTLQAQRDAAAMIEARRSFETAIATLQDGNAAAITDREYLLAAAWMNYANALAWSKTAPDAQHARDAAKQALALASASETHSMAMGEVSLKSRHILCQVIVELLAEKGNPQSIKDELIAEATDVVDDGLALARHWERRRAGRFRPLARELFCFGARAYQIFQPHFLNEFLLENLDPAHSSGAFADDSQMHGAALDSLWRSFREIQRDGFRTLDAARFEKFLEKLRELSVAEERLAELRRQYVAAR